MRLGGIYTAVGLTKFCVQQTKIAFTRASPVQRLTSVRVKDTVVVRALTLGTRTKSVTPVSRRGRSHLSG